MFVFSEFPVCSFRLFGLKSYPVEDVLCSLGTHCDEKLITKLIKLWRTIAKEYEPGMSSIKCLHPEKLISITSNFLSTCSDKSKEKLAVALLNQISPRLILETLHKLAAPFAVSSRGCHTDFGDFIPSTESSRKLAKMWTWFLLTRRKKQKFVKKAIMEWIHFSPDKDLVIQEILRGLPEIKQGQNLLQVAEGYLEIFGRENVNVALHSEVFLIGLFKVMNSYEEMKSFGTPTKENIKLKLVISNKLVELAIFYNQCPFVWRPSLLSAYSLCPSLTFFNYLFPEEEEEQVNYKMTDYDSLFKILERHPELSFKKKSSADNNKSPDSSLPSNVTKDLYNVTQVFLYAGFSSNDYEEIKRECLNLLVKRVEDIENQTLNFVEVDYDKCRNYKPQYDENFEDTQQGYTLEQWEKKEDKKKTKNQQQRQANKKAVKVNLDSAELAKPESLETGIKVSVQERRRMAAVKRKKMTEKTSLVQKRQMELEMERKEKEKQNRLSRLKNRRARCESSHLGESQTSSVVVEPVPKDLPNLSTTTTEENSLEFHSTSPIPSPQPSTIPTSLTVLDDHLIPQQNPNFQEFLEDDVFDPVYQDGANNNGANNNGANNNGANNNGWSSDAAALFASSSVTTTPLTLQMNFPGHEATSTDKMKVLDDSCEMDQDEEANDMCLDATAINNEVIEPPQSVITPPIVPNAAALIQIAEPDETAQSDLPNVLTCNNKNVLASSVDISSKLRRSTQVQKVTTKIVKPGKIGRPRNDPPPPKIPKKRGPKKKKMKFLPCQFKGCKRVFNYPSDLLIHVKIHDKSYAPFKCTTPGCNKAFNTATYQRTHSRLYCKIARFSAL